MTSKKSKGFGADEPEVEELLTPIVEEEVKEEKKPKVKKVVEPEPTPEPEPPAPPAPPAPVEKKKLHRIIKRR